MVTPTIRPSLGQFFDFLDKTLSLLDYTTLVSIVTDNAGEGQGVIGLAAKLQEWSQLETHGGQPGVEPPRIAFRSVPRSPALIVLSPPVPPFSAGPLLIESAWQAGLTPRVYDSYASSGPSTANATIAFVPFADEGLAATPVDLVALRQSAACGPFETSSAGGSRGDALRAIAERIASDYGIRVRAEQDLLDRPVFLDFANPVSVAHVLDAAALVLAAAWDWRGDSVAMRPPPAARGT
jgi:hypothetical protein